MNDDLNDTGMELVLMTMYLYVGSVSKVISPKLCKVLSALSFLISKTQSPIQNY